jgi:signal transduction histidine kinase
VDPEWLEATLSRLTLLLCTLGETNALARLLLEELAPATGAAQGAVYVLDTRVAREEAWLSLCASYAAGPDLPERCSLGEGLVGQCALDRKKLVVRGVSSDHFRVRSGLGVSAPAELVFVPVWLDTAHLGVVELAFADGMTPARDALLSRLAERRAPRSELAPLAAGSSSFGAVQRLPGFPRLRPGQKSGFWGKLSHELRSPLNSVLVLSQLLAENAEANLTAKQVTFASAIHNSGNDLLALVNAISDLTKIENNRLVLEPTEMHFDQLEAHLVRAFEPVAKGRGLQFLVELGPGLPDAIVTDAKRVRQIMKCLLSNAFKFTENGSVAVRVAVRASGWPPEHERLTHAPEVVAFSVSDTGVGMPESERDSIFEAFPPERVEARRGAGASGLGLAISRELARLLGGALQVESEVGSGSTFTLFLPSSGLAKVPTEEAPPESGPARPEQDAGSGLAILAAPGPNASGAEGEAAGREPAGVDGAEPALRRMHPAQLAGHTILLVEDDVRSAFALTGFLERQGAEVSHAEDVEEALGRLEANRQASAILIDAELLESGAEGSISNVLLRCRLPVIALARSARIARGLRMPPEVHLLPKPVDPHQLLRVLSAVVNPPSSLQSQSS